MKNIKFELKPGSMPSRKKFQIKIKKNLKKVKRKKKFEKQLESKNNEK